MSEGEQKKVKVVEEEEVDLISSFPDELLGSIICLLPYMEVVRTSVLSKRWESLWKNTPDLSFDQRQMLKSLIEDYIQNSQLADRLTMAMERKVAPKNEEYFDVITEAAMMITSNIDSHIGPLKSCTIRHLPESCASADVVGWLRKLMEKRVIKVSIERESCDYRNGGILDRDVKLAASTIDLPFEVFSNFKVLELKNYRFNTTPSPYSEQTLKTLTLNKVRIILNTFHDILSYCSSLENLTVENCDFLRDELKIVSPSLKYIKICNMNVLRILVSAFNVEVIEVDSIICRHQDLVFEAPKLQVLRAYNDFQIHGQIVFIHGRKLLTARDIIEICGGILLLNMSF
ncbi:F-box/RNI superfamily protein [Medicago truncatula]|uniref:F-box/RNI superfamily protein n=1 Tax=Medicago truncatula TaxID=3880 RepID=G7IJB8_MEDTR|nr:F-box/RNI superfamily protein [Medicago truncatula]